MMKQAIFALSILVFASHLAQPAISQAASSLTAAATKVYVGLLKDNAVAVLDTSTNRVLKTIPVPPGPHGLVAAPHGHKVYVSSDGASTVSVIDTEMDRVVNSIEVGPTPHGLAISPDGSRILVSVWGANQAVIIDTASEQIVGRMPVLQPHNSAISPDGRTAYVGSQQQGATGLVILDLVSRTQIGKIPLDKTPRALDLSPDGKQLYFTVAGANAVQVLDTASNRVVGQIPVGASPHYPLFTPNGHSGLVVSQGPGELEILDPTTRTVSGTVRVGKSPHWIAVSSDGGTAYVTNEGSDDVSVVDLASRQVTATIGVGHAPRKIAIQPGQAAKASVPAPAPAGSATQPASDHGTKDVKSLTELDVEADDYYFEPTFLQGRPGQKLTLIIENESGTLHNFSIPEQQLDKDVPPKSKVTVEVTVPQSGTALFFCKFHAPLGMKGELLANDATPLEPRLVGSVALDRLKGAGHASKFP